ncbi:MAG: response regulator [Synechococcaceae cyanobacterium RL_1_2]|nr:response regulator [Synechococcaceae cyanobacterium RL_1_2]
MNQVKVSFLQALAQQLSVIGQKKLTGKLSILEPPKSFYLHFVAGQLIHLEGLPHPYRTWKRATHSQPQENLPLSQEESWPGQVMARSIHDQLLTPTIAKQLLTLFIEESFFNLARLDVPKLQWVTQKPSFAPKVALNFPEMKTILIKTLQLHQQWNQAGLGKLDPNLSPQFVNPTPTSVLGGLGLYLQGEHTVWDLAQVTNKSLVVVTRSLVPLVQKKALTFKIINDLPLENIQVEVEVEVEEEVVVNSNNQKPARNPVDVTIACVDDSPIIGQALIKILQPFGYNVLSILDPIKGFSELIKSKPDLIFLDLIMPKANGYSICQKLRKTALFKDTPIVILSSRSSDLDRERAKKVGANDFLSKPPQSEQVMNIIAHYL